MVGFSMAFMTLSISNFSLTSSVCFGVLEILIAIECLFASCSMNIDVDV